MNKHLISKFILAAGFLYVSVVFPSQTSAQESAPAKAARILNESKVKFAKIADNVWSVPYNGKSLKNFQVLISTNANVLFMFVDVASQKDYKPSAEMFSALLVQNDEMDRVKIGLDKDRAVSVRIDLSIRLLDKKEFVENLDQLAAASDQIYSILQPHLVKPN